MTMEPTIINYKKLDDYALPPSYQHGEEDAGADLYALGDYRIPTRVVSLVRTGIALEIPVGYVGIIKGRSSVEKYGLHIHAGVIDPGYRGEVLIMLYNESYNTIKVNNRQRIAQLLIVPTLYASFMEAKELEESKRGEDGFGSTGE